MAVLLYIKRDVFNFVLILHIILLFIYHIKYFNNYQLDIMAEESLRQRGWSIHSSDNDDHHNNQQQQRPRADTDMTDNTLTSTEKKLLLDNAFNDGDDKDDGEVVVKSPPRDKEGKGRGGDDMIAMFGEEGEDSAKNNSNNDNKKSASDEPPTKRRKIMGEEGVTIAIGNEFGILNDNDSSGDDGDDSSSSDDESASVSNKEDGKLSSTTLQQQQQQRPHVELTQKQQEQLNMAKNKLSKWAARLFDPNRPRGLVEAPQVIPLNDEFLTAFGKREKEYDALSGKEIEIDQTSLDIIDISDGGDGNDDDSVKGRGKKSTNKNEKKVDFSKMDKCKVKISNLSYKTTTATIARTCGQVGPVVDVNLILDDNGQSSGRAYVVFEDHESAVTFSERHHEKTLEGRTLYIGLASSSGGRKSLDPSKKRQESRYWDRDISTKCNSCGEVGHIARECPNEEKLRPCSLCAGLGHEMWSCPMKSVCFNCGLPGHVVRDCNQRRGLPERRVCTICFMGSHHRFDCREWPWDAPTRDSLCMQCGQKGHLMCNEMRWFFGLKGTSCFNCGEKGHTGIRCNRPDVDVCQKNPDIASQEVEMAGTISLSDQLSNQKSSRESRDSRQRDSNPRARSQPPPRNSRGMPQSHRRY